MKKVVLYTTATCPYCIRALALLDKKGVVYENIDVSANREVFEAVKKRTQCRTVPQIMIDDTFIGGCDDLYALEQGGRLNQVLGLEG